MSIRASELHFFRVGVGEVQALQGEISHPRSIEFPLRCTKCTTGQSTNSNPYTLSTVHAKQLYGRQSNSVVVCSRFSVRSCSVACTFQHLRSTCMSAAGVQPWQTCSQLKLSSESQCMYFWLQQHTRWQHDIMHFFTLRLPRPSTRPRQTLVQLLRHYSRRHLLEGYRTLTRCRPRPHAVNVHWHCRWSAPMLCQF